jgi:uncharacterized protein (TIGR03437 family)
LDPQQPTRIVVQPFTSNLAAGVYNGTLTLQFTDGRVGSVKITVIVSNGSATGSSTTRTDAKSLRTADAEASCPPTKLLPALTTLGQSFAVSAGWPVALGVDVKDDCGTPLDTGAVSVSFSNGDPPVLLTPLKGGRWEGTWATSNTAQAEVTLKLAAENPLAENAQVAPSIPLSTDLVDTEVIMAGKKLPLYYVGQTQVNAIVPYGLNVNTTHQVLVRRGLTYSRPVSVDVAPAQPAVFADAKGVPYIFANPPDHSPAFQVTPATPAKAGDTLVIYCAGLGVTDQSLDDGAAAPKSPLARTKNPVQVRIAGVNATVQFAGLAPTFVGLYQVNVVVPSGVQSGDEPLVLSVAGQASAPLNLPVR